MKVPNPEQKIAIEHNGGVLLQAGAGSGKTFVLIEHVYYLLKNFISHNKNKETDFFEKDLRKYFRSIVVMTFTKKAAGELSIRLKKRINHEIKFGGENEKFWTIVNSNLEDIFVGTIHSFCLKIMSDYSFNQSLLDFKIISKYQMDILLGKYFEKVLSKYIDRDDKILEMIRANSKPLLAAMSQIFFDSSLRESWEEMNIDAVDEYSFEKIIERIVDMHGLSDLFEGNYIENIDIKEKSKKWAEYILKAHQTLKRPTSLDDLKCHGDFFKGYSRLPAAPRNADASTRELFKSLKKYRDFTNSFYEHFLMYDQNKSGVIKQWNYWLKKIFDEINLYYNKSGYINFSDLEYITLGELRHNSKKNKNLYGYQYLIVDEFQDTSNIQFEIIRHVINNNFKKLFVVGDVKQAIYGFRGGEVSVFKDCEDKVSEKLELKTNYRSSLQIVNFNNNFFCDIFKQGLGFEGKVEYPIEFPHQTAVQEFPNAGARVLVKDIFDERKLSSREINAIESETIIELIEKEVSGDETICILYKSIAPSLSLIEGLLNKNIGFTAQIKIPFEEDPIFILFYQLISGYLAKQDQKATIFIANGILSYLKAKKSFTKEDLTNFYLLTDQIGAYHAFIKLVFDQGISSSLWQTHLVHLVLEVCHDNLEKFYLCFNRIKEESFSFDFQFGENPRQIQIMTVHASKGLEFDRVILAGIHSNGKKRSRDSIFGKYPGSFCWKSSIHQKKFYRSPYFILEDLEKKYKDFSEDKRLFYVAATRAKKQLIWIDFNIDETCYKAYKQSWIYAFRSNISEHTKNLIKKENYGKYHRVPIKTEIKRPFFHEKSLGIISLEDREEKALLVGELSVTGIATLKQCPRKFFLSQILKISNEDIDILEKSNQLLDTQKYGISSAQRGINIHQTLSQIIEQKTWNIPLHVKEDRSLLRWTIELLKSYKNCQFISEKPLKFVFWGIMVSGTPDLIIKDDKKTIIWDFKTGLQKDQDDHYWVQLKIYALAMWELGNVDRNDPIELSLLYLDEQKKLSNLFYFYDIKEELFSLWEQANLINQVNRNHCSSCDYGNLCRF